MVDEEKEKVRFVTPDWVKPPPPVMEVRQMRSQFILGLYSLMKAAQVHGADNVALDQSISQYLRLINHLILSEGGITLGITDEGILLNDRKIRGKPGDHTVFKLFMRNLIGLRIRKLEIRNPLDERELKELIFLLVALKEGDENNPRYLMKEFNAREINSITVDSVELKEKALPQTVERRRYARELYFAAIGVVREIMEEVADGKAFNMRKAKRLMQEMVNLCMEDEPFLLGLAAIKDYGQYLYNHSVNVCLYSIVLGLQLDLPKKNLVQLGIAGLFHDIGKIRVSASILGKSSQLTAEEWNVIQRHPIFGVETIVSLNTIMVDGTGMCGCCRVSVGGITRFACVDGPDFDGHQVDWDLVLSRQRIYLDEEKQSFQDWQHKCGIPS